MSLRLYRDSGLMEMISRDGAQSQPDRENSLDGLAGETAEADLYLWPEHALLAAGIDDTEETEFQLDRAAFASQKFPHCKIDNEEVLITAGWGTGALTVIRGYNGSEPSTHAPGAVLVMICDYSDIRIAPDDLEGDDESYQLEYSLDGGSNWFAALDGQGGNPQPPDMNHADPAVTVRRRITIPADHAVIRRIDLRHVVTFTAEVPQA